MCGIAGYFGTRNIPRSTISSVLNKLKKRGPDSSNVKLWDAGWADSESPVNALFHTRLSIRDTRSIANQPMSNRTKDIWIVYNGEIYDWEQYKPELERNGVRFRTTGDTEFILHAYEAWGLGMLSKLRGMFAIAILDLRKRKLILIRDRMGLKPILFTKNTFNFGFASTTNALLPFLNDNEKELSTKGIEAYLAHRYIPAPLSIFKNIARLQNGHYLTYDLVKKKTKIVNYWQPEGMTGDWKSSLVQSTRIRTVSDRPVGLFLSGGIDSTVMASILSKTNHRDFVAFTASFSGSSLDEADLAKRTAKTYGFTHEIINIPKEINNEQFTNIISDLDEPIADPSCFPAWFLCKEASKVVKVVLGGDGGDELFAGYKRYKKHLRSEWRKDLRIPIKIRWKSRSRFGKIFSEISYPWREAYAYRFSGFPMPERALIQNIQPSQIQYWRGMEYKGSPKGVHHLLDIDRNNYLPEYVLRKGDLCGMSHGLEIRCPFLDHEFYQALIKIPDQERFTSPAKIPLHDFIKEASHILNVPKMGFNPPLETWLKFCWRERFSGLGGRLNKKTDGFLSSKGIDDYVSSFLDGESSLAERALQLLMLDESLTHLLSIES